MHSLMLPTGFRRGACAAALLPATPFAGAHVPQPDAAVPAIGWSFEPWVLACLGASLLLYAAGLLRLWRKAGAGFFQRGARKAAAGPDRSAANDAAPDRNAASA